MGARRRTGASGTAAAGPRLWCGAVAAAVIRGCGGCRRWRRRRGRGCCPRGGWRGCGCACGRGREVGGERRPVVGGGREGHGNCGAHDRRVAARSVVWCVVCFRGCVVVAREAIEGDRSFSVRGEARNPLRDTGPRHGQGGVPKIWGAGGGELGSLAGEEARLRRARGRRWLLGLSGAGWRQPKSSGPGALVSRSRRSLRRLQLWNARGRTRRRRTWTPGTWDGTWEPGKACVGGVGGCGRGDQEKKGVREPLQERQDCPRTGESLIM